ncbi:MAG: adenylate/guanylate cyclase domain-containing protein [Flavobacterium sp.]
MKANTWDYSQQNKQRRSNIYFLIVFSLIWNASRAQNKTKIDSLEVVFLDRKFHKNEELSILNTLAIHHFDTEKKLKYSALLIQRATSKKELGYLLQGYLEIGNAYRLKSDFSDALTHYFKAAQIANAKNFKKRLPVINIAIADVYALLDKKSKALAYYNKSIALLRLEKDSTNLASALLNTGDLYISSNSLDSALVTTREAKTIFEKLKSATGLAYSLGNLGMIYARLKEDTKAEANINRAIMILSIQKDYYPICVYLMIMADIYIEKKEPQKALTYSLRSLALAKKYGLKTEITQSNLKLSKIYESKNDFQKSLWHYKAYTFYNDSIKNIESVKKLAEIQANYEIYKKQLEVNQLSKERRTQRIITIVSWVSVLLLFGLIFGLFRRYKYVKATKKIIEIEKDRSNNLLLNILPEATAQELKENGKVVAKKMESVTVLFSDFVDFTKYSEQMEPEALVQHIDFYFSKFDEIMERFGIEKIKTIGDCYMCAGGLPFASEDHAIKIVAAAQEIIEFVESCSIAIPPQKCCFQIRIGIHTGPVVAGVVGTRKFAYDIWGDTVNIASRMESSSSLGRINISQTTYELVKNHYEFEYRGEIEAKNKGKMKMYFLNQNPH